MGEVSKALYKFFDANNDGGITLQELKDAMSGVGVKFSDEQVTTFFNKYDADGNGEIDFTEFVALSVALNARALSGEEQAMAKLFDGMDADGNRSLSHTEIRAGIAAYTGKPVDSKEVAALIKQLDIDGDGEVSYEEFSQNILTKIAMAIKNDI